MKKSILLFITAILLTLTLCTAVFAQDANLGDTDRSDNGGEWIGDADGVIEGTSDEADGGIMNDVTDSLMGEGSGAAGDAAGNAGSSIHTVRKNRMNFRKIFFIEQPSS